MYPRRYRTSALRLALLLVFTFTLHAGGFSQTSNLQELPQGGVYHVGRGIIPPRVIGKLTPAPPLTPGGKPLEGTTVLQLVVGADGSPRDIRVERSLRPDYDERAIEAVSHWKFSPATKDGQPVPVLINV